MAKVAERSGGVAGREEAAQDIERELRALRADVAALAQSLREYGALAAGEMRERAQEASGGAMAEAETAIRALRGQAEGLQAQLEGNVRANPLVWLAGAVGLGLLLGLLSGRGE